eukprot:TRINITY_DN2481_c0_g1_i1.p1 TRINITY_DN2481_c0_g1~~TRINITY_DN2481_c0_g1_i1.p1  ORF type:complete len:136 (-),score=39.05 TRINITY_DN2481_c0_g1_i1:673-1080(-)
MIPLDFIWKWLWQNFAPIEQKQEILVSSTNGIKEVESTEASSPPETAANDVSSTKSSNSNANTDTNGNSNSNGSTTSPSPVNNTINSASSNNGLEASTSSQESSSKGIPKDTLVNELLSLPDIGVAKSKSTETFC